MSTDAAYRQEDPRAHVVTDPEGWQRIDTRDRKEFVVGPGGVYVVQTNELWKTLRPASRKDFDQLFARREGLLGTLGLGRSVPRTPIPQRFLATATMFFRQVWQRYRREDILLLYLYYEEGRYEFQHPRLLAAGDQHVDCEIPETPEAAVRAGTFHSHGDEPAFHSWADERDDLKSPGIHVILGDVDRRLPLLCCVFSDGEDCFKVSPEDVFADPVTSGELTVEIPPNWFVANVPKWSWDSSQSRGGTERKPEVPPPHRRYAREPTQPMDKGG